MTTSFDPWDMPYFGAATYFSYQAAFWHPEGPESDAAVPGAPATPTTGSSLPSDPWDAPYFGGTVYLSYSPALPDRPVHSDAAGPGVSTPSNLEPEPAPVEAGTTLVTNVPARPRRRGWWARLFGQS
jgi:hypothetical protein